MTTWPVLNWLWQRLGNGVKLTGNQDHWQFLPLLESCILSKQGQYVHYDSLDGSSRFEWRYRARNHRVVFFLMVWGLSYRSSIFGEGGTSLPLYVCGGQGTPDGVSSFLCQVGLYLLSHVNSLFVGIFENQFLETQLSIGKRMGRQKTLSLDSEALWEEKEATGFSEIFFMELRDPWGGDLLYIEERGRKHSKCLSWSFPFKRVFIFLKMCISSKLGSKSEG